MSDASHTAHAPELEYYDLQTFSGGKNCMLPPQVKTCGASRPLPLVKQ